MRSFLFVANWKLNPKTIVQAKKIITEIEFLLKKQKVNNKNIVICPPFPFIFNLSNKLNLGAQDVFYEDEGAYTGAVSGLMLKSVGVKYVIIGHSELRERGDGPYVSEKVASALKAKINTVVCIGEKERLDDGVYWEEIRLMIQDALSKVSKKDVSKVIIAYEPVWAIGSKSKGVISPENLRETIIFIRKVITEMFGGKAGSSMKIIYGGSVDSKNSKELLSVAMADGFLVGRASLSPKDFVEIAKGTK